MRRYNNGVQGIPDGNSDCKFCTTTCDGCNTVPHQQAFDDSSVGYDTGGYTRVHRDSSIISAMNKWMAV